MASVCVGCGLDIATDGKLIVATSGEFTDLHDGYQMRQGTFNPDTARELVQGVALAALCNTKGQIVYCDSNGELRTAPEKFNVEGHESNSSFGDSPVNPGETVDYIENVHPGPGAIALRGVLIENPSDCYSMLVESRPYAEVQLTYHTGAPGEGNTVNVQRQSRISIDGAPFGAFVNDSNVLQPVFTGLTTTIIVQRERGPIIIGPGETYHIQTRIQVTNPPGAGRVLSILSGDIANIVKGSNV